MYVCVICDFVFVMLVQPPDADVNPEFVLHWYATIPEPLSIAFAVNVTFPFVQPVGDIVGVVIVGAVLSALLKLAVTVIALAIVPLVDDQPVNVVIYPVAFVILAVAFLPSLKVNVCPLTEYVVLFLGTIKLVVDILP